MRGQKAVVGVFGYLDDVIKAVEQVKSAQYDFRVYSPVPNHDLEAVTYPQKSPVRFFTGAGAVAGLVFGFGIAIWMSLDWPLRTSAKDIASIPAFVVIGYECTILFGAIFTLMAMFHFCRIPDVLKKVGYDPRFTDDKFGVVVGCDPRDVEQVSAQLREAGAEEVEVRETL